MKHAKILYSCVLFFALLACVEEIDFVSNSETFESALVVEAVLTNEPKQHLIKLSRTYRFEEEGPNPESQAQVYVLANGQTYEFTEIEPGTYLSNDTFAAQPNVDYQLKITTSNGRTYSSSTTQLTQTTQLDDIYVERIINDFGADGVGVFVDSFNPTGLSRFYRYEYEETYKIIAPYYRQSNLKITEGGSLPCSLELVNRNENVRVCYNTLQSSEIILTSTENLQIDKIEGFQVRFLPKTAFIISHRYSILVKQYVQQPEAFLYYNKLKEISSQAENLFSQLQPGFLTGNVYSNTNSNDRVIGFFEVSSVSEARVFFNFNDIFPNEELPPFVINCIPFSPEECDEVIGGLNNNSLTFWDFNPEPEERQGPYWLVPSECGDCTELGSIEVPDFWEE